MLKVRLIKEKKELRIRKEKKSLRIINSNNFQRRLKNIAKLSVQNSTEYICVIFLYYFILRPTKMLTRQRSRLEF